MPSVAQEEDTSTTTDTSDVTAPSDDAASPVVDEVPAPVSVPARVAPSRFDFSASPARELAAVRGLPGTLYNFRYQFDTRLRDLRLGADTRERLSFLLPRLPEPSAKLNDIWQQIVPPPNLATVHQYALAAVVETDAGVQITLSNFNAGGSSIPPSGVAHFDRSDQLMSAALLAIDKAAGP